MHQSLLNDHQYKEKIDLLLELIGNINSNLEVKRVLRNIIEAAMKITDSEASSVYLLDEDEQELILTVPTGPISERIHGRRFPISDGIAGWVARNAVPQIVNDVKKDDRFYGDFEPEVFITRNIICVPLNNQSEEVIGVLQALNKKNGADFEESEISLFQVLAHQAAIAITNARLHEERTTLLSEIHHRVKNNMAVISGMIQLQAFNEPNEEMQNKLLKGVTRISSMAMVHEELYEANSFSSLNYTKSLKKVVESTIITLEDNKNISTTFDCENITLNINQSIPCSLIISEIVFHIVKFGFENIEKPTMMIELVENSETKKIQLKINDNGESVHRYLMAMNSGESGFQLIQVLSQQLEAEFDYKAGESENSFILQFEKSDRGGAGSYFL